MRLPETKTRLPESKNRGLFPLQVEGWCLEALPPHAKGTMIESVQPQENKLSFALSLSLAAGACVRVCLVRPLRAPSLRRCPQLSTLVKGKCAVLPSAQIQPKLSLGGGPMEVRVAPFPSQIEGPAWNSRWISPMTYAEGEREGWKGRFPCRSAPQVVSHSLTHSLTHSRLQPSSLENRAKTFCRRLSQTPWQRCAATWTARRLAASTGPSPQKWVHKYVAH